ncbi:hypothetical protein HK096_007643 [Nowakowskiella sp. JEL0078]|nr:hypothetical protein HK096_007643 [Nowakowskiella sp. JEL0078]
MKLSQDVESVLKPEKRRSDSKSETNSEISREKMIKSKLSQVSILPSTNPLNTRNNDRPQSPLKIQIPNNLFSLDLPTPTLGESLWTSLPRDFRGSAGRKKETASTHRTSSTQATTVVSDALNDEVKTPRLSKDISFMKKKISVDDFDPSRPLSMQQIKPKNRPTSSSAPKRSNSPKSSLADIPNYLGGVITNDWWSSEPSTTSQTEDISFNRNNKDHRATLTSMVSLEDMFASWNSVNGTSPDSMNTIQGPAMLTSRSSTVSTIVPLSENRNNTFKRSSGVSVAPSFEHKTLPMDQTKIYSLGRSQKTPKNIEQHIDILNIPSDSTNSSISTIDSLDLQEIHETLQRLSETQSRTSISSDNDFFAVEESISVSGSDNSHVFTVSSRGIRSVRTESIDGADDNRSRISEVILPKTTELPLMQPNSGNERSSPHLLVQLTQQDVESPNKEVANPLSPGIPFAHLRNLSTGTSDLIGELGPSNSSISSFLSHSSSGGGSASNSLNLLTATSNEEDVGTRKQRFVEYLRTRMDTIDSKDQNTKQVYASLIDKLSQSRPTSRQFERYSLMNVRMSQGYPPIRSSMELKPNLELDNNE